RDAFGERSYLLQDVEKLRVIKRLLDQGQRPGRIVALPIEELQRLSQGLAGERMPGAGVALFGSDAIELRDYLQMIKDHRSEDLRRALGQAAINLGLTRFVTELVAPLNVRVGEAWMRGELEVFEEHLYTESVTAVMRNTIANVPEQGAHSSPKVLLTTFPQESHALGLLMAQSLMAVEGCRCVSLGPQTPIRDIALAAQAHLVDVVALSCSVNMNPNHVADGLQELRAMLPDSVRIWAGGGSTALRRREIPGVLALPQLDDIAPAVRQWRADQAAR
ncbi:MAG: cobalamin B12-binding domain-containing protein, partial [Betaproteobacteria bacterium]|nr:cobalamin B12-binding domain-containing protein [Betaproteobacteria bacterium]